MRCGWLIAAISSLVLFFPAGHLQGQQTDDDPVVSKKVALPPAKPLPTANPGAEYDVRPLAELADAFESGQFEIPDGASAQELVLYIQGLSKLGNGLNSDYRRIQAMITKAQGKAAERILVNPESVSDQDFYLAAKLGLSQRISQIPFSTPEEQQRTFAYVARQLEIGAQSGLKLDEIRNVLRTADYLERYGDRVLALEACANSSAFSALRITRDTRSPWLRSKIRHDVWSWWAVRLSLRV